MKQKPFPNWLKKESWNLIFQKLQPLSRRGRLFKINIEIWSAVSSNASENTPILLYFTVQHI